MGGTRLGELDRSKNAPKISIDSRDRERTLLVVRNTTGGQSAAPEQHWPRDRDVWFTALPGNPFSLASGAKCQLARLPVDGSVPDWQRRIGELDKYQYAVHDVDDEPEEEDLFA